MCVCDVYISPLEVYRSNSSKSHPRGLLLCRFFTFLFWAFYNRERRSYFTIGVYGRESSIRECGIRLDIRTEAAAREARRRENRNLLPEDRQPSDATLILHELVY